MPTRELAAGTVAMPLCARCAGMYVGFAAALPCFLLRARRNGMPPRPAVWALAAVALAAWAADGAANAVTWVDTPAAARLGLGMLVGLSLSPIVAALFAATVSGARGLTVAPAWTAAALVAAALLGAAANARPAPALLAVESYASALGLVVFLAVVHMALLTIILRRRPALVAAAAAVTVTAQIVLLSIARTMIGV